MGFWCFFFVLSTIFTFVVWEGGGVVNLGIPIYNNNIPFQCWVITIISKLGLFTSLIIIYCHRNGLFSIDDIFIHFIKLYPNSKFLAYLYKKIKNKKIKWFIIIILFSLLLSALINLLILVSVQYFKLLLADKVVKTLLYIVTLFK